MFELAAGCLSEAAKSDRPVKPGDELPDEGHEVGVVDNALAAVAQR